jgi:hypothetical protein
MTYTEWTDTMHTQELSLQLGLEPASKKAFMRVLRWSQAPNRA